MATIRRSKKTRFSSLSNALLQDSSLSFECRGMLAYLLSKPASWECKVYDIEREGGIKETARRRIMVEAEKAGYLTFSKYRNERGQFESGYTVHEEPVPVDQRTESWNTNQIAAEPPPENPPLDNPALDEPPLENPGGLIKTDKESTDKEKKETAAVQSPASASMSNQPANKTAADSSDPFVLENEIRRACNLSGMYDPSTERRVNHLAMALKTNGFTAEDVKAFRETRRNIPNISYLLTDMQAWRNNAPQPKASWGKCVVPEGLNASERKAFIENWARQKMAETSASI